MPVWLENDAPNTRIRSLSFINHDATGVPERPSTPAASGWESGIWPFALNVVMTGAPSRSASSTIGSIWKRTPVADDDDRAARAPETSARRVDRLARGSDRGGGDAAPRGGGRRIAGREGLGLVGGDQVRRARSEERVLACERHQLGVLGLA